MKKYTAWCMFLLLLLAPRQHLLAQAAKITAGEYFYDIDPGTGNGIPITISSATDSVSVTLNTATTGLSGGFHQLFTRFKDANNQWGIAEQRTFYLDASFSGAASKIIAGEYFFDTDPGTGNATAITVVKTDSINTTYNISAVGLKGGFHQLFIRYQDSLSNWGLAEQRPFYVDTALGTKPTKITAGEYFFDKDPGVGKGKAISTAKTDSVNKVLSIATTGLKTGFHQLYIRYKDTASAWGIAEQRPFYVDSTVLTKAAPIVAGEYFFTKDKGVGTGTPLTIVKTDSVNQTFSIVVPASFAVGNQYLEIRFKDSVGKWGIAEGRKIKIVCKPDLGKDTTVTICAGSTTDITGLYSYTNYASFSWNTPTPTAVGAGTYRLIATSSLGCSDTAFVTVANFAPVITASGSTNICAGSSVTLNAGAGYTSYLWSTGATTQTITVSAAGTFTCTVTNSSGCTATSASVQVTVKPNNTPGITAGGPTTFCPGGNVTLTATPGLTAYLWSTGETTQSINASNAGNYSVQGTNTNGCVSAFSTPVAVTLNPVPDIPVINASGAVTNLCPGATVTLTSSVAPSYLWSTGATTQSITVSAAGSYTVTVFNATNCSSVSAATVVTYLSCGTPSPIGAQNTTATSATLTWKKVPCAVAYQIQYRKGTTGTFTTITTSNTDTTYLLSGLLANTTYQWRVAAICQTSPLILSANSTNQTFTTPATFGIGISTAIGKLSVSVTPNPASSFASVIVANAKGKISITLTDLSGKQHWQTITTSYKVNIDVSRYASGTYMVIVKDEKETKTLKLVKE